MAKAKTTGERIADEIVRKAYKLDGVRRVADMLNDSLPRRIDRTIDRAESAAFVRGLMEGQASMMIRLIAPTTPGAKTLAELKPAKCNRKKGKK